MLIWSRCTVFDHTSTTSRKPLSILDAEFALGPGQTTERQLPDEKPKNFEILPLPSPSTAGAWSSNIDVIKICGSC
jgi:hypothetical protein